jgi:hypothetical protein
VAYSGTAANSTAPAEGAIFLDEIPATVPSRAAQKELYWRLAASSGWGTKKIIYEGLQSLRPFFFR